MHRPSVSSDTVMPPIIRHDAAASRFECTVEGRSCVAAYRLEGDRLLMTHTHVPPMLEGRGIAAALVDAALAHAAANRWTVVPLCSYVAARLARRARSGRDG